MMKLLNAILSLDLGFAFVSTLVLSQLLRGTLGILRKDGIFFILLSEYLRSFKL